MNFRQLLKSISRREWAVAGVVSVAVVAVTAVPPLFGYLTGVARGVEWTGMQVFAPGDLGVYLSYIEQGRSGTPYMENIFTTDPAHPVFNIFWFSVGRLAWLLGLPALAAYHAARLLLIPVLLAVTYVALSYFLPKTRDRLAAFLMLVFGSGVGLYFAPFFSGTGSTLSGHEWPIDLWVSESNMFASMTYSPHFVASWLLLIVAALFLAMALDNRSVGHGAVAGTAALILFSFHPFHAPTLCALGLAYLFVSSEFRKREFASSCAVFSVFVLISAPAVLYHYLITRYADFGREMLTANTCLTPSFWHVLIGFGTFMILAPAGFALVRSGRAEVRQAGFLVTWILVGLVLVYSPLPFQRRLLEGIEFPLAALAAPGAFAAFGLIGPALKRYALPTPFVVALLFAVFLLPSSSAAITRNVDLYRKDNPPISYFPPARSAALRWVRDNTSEDDAFMSDFSSGYHVAGWTIRRVYVGHWVNSGDIGTKRGDVRRFFGEMDDGARRDFMLGNGMTHVWYGPEEKALGSFGESDAFERVFTEGDIDIFRLQ